MLHQQINLAEHRAELQRFWDGACDEFLPLSTAAGILIHQVHESATSNVSLPQYQDALNVAAAALSCLIPIYAAMDGKDGPTALDIDLTRQRFRNGATEVRGNDGTCIVQLSVERSSLSVALPVIKRVGLPLLMID